VEGTQERGKITDDGLVLSPDANSYEKSNTRLI
jgi:hypothetical protein